MKKTICILLAVLMTAFSAVPAFAADPSTAAYTKNNVLLQAAQSMLAQANQNSSSVLSLLQ